MFKHKKDKTRFFHLHPLAAMLCFEMQFWAEQNNLPWVVTSTVSTLSEDKKYGRVSSSHRTGRAFDVSVNGWSPLEQSRFRMEFNRKYKDIAALSGSNLHPSLVVIHTGTARHMHIQIHSKYSRDIHLVGKVKNSSEN